MKTDYSEDLAFASEAIAEDGKTALLIRQITTGPAYNPVTTESEIEIDLVEIGFSLTNRNDTLVQAGDKIGLISAGGEQPLFSDKVSIDDSRYSFIELEPLNPGNTVILYEFKARK